MAWRICLAIFAVLLGIGGPMHPRGSMAQMLADPKWVPAHALVTAAFIALLAGWLILWRSALPPKTRLFLRLAIIGTAAQCLEYLAHTFASVDAANLVAGRPTPVLSTHLAMAVIAYPAFGITLIGLIVAGMRERSLGSYWIGWLGMIGAAAHALAAPLVVALEVEWAGILFPFIMLVALWALSAAVWPARAPSPTVA